MITILENIEIGKVSHPKYGDGVFAYALLSAEYYPTVEETLDNANVEVIDQDGDGVGHKNIGELNNSAYSVAVNLITKAWENTFNNLHEMEEFKVF